MRETDPKILQLRAVPGLEGLDPGLLHSLPQLVDEVTLDAGQILVRQGTAGRQAFIVVEGRATVLVDGEPVASVGPGAFIGEMAMLDHEVRSATVKADTPMRALVIGARDFPSLASHPAVARAISAQLSQRLRRTETG